MPAHRWKQSGAITSKRSGKSVPVPELHHWLGWECSLSSKSTWKARFIEIDTLHADVSPWLPHFRTGFLSADRNVNRAMQQCLLLSPFSVFLSSLSSQLVLSILLLISILVFSSYCRYPNFSRRCRHLSLNFTVELQNQLSWGWAPQKFGQILIWMT